MIFTRMSSILPGSIIDSKYRINRTISLGTNSSVYEVKDISQRRPESMALKIFHSERISKHDEDHLRYHNELRIVRQIVCPGIVTIHDIGNYDGNSYIVTELVRGRSIAELLDTGKSYSVEATVNIVSKIATVLGILAENGIAHKDLKPSNVMLSNVEKDGVPVKAILIDFGVFHIKELAAAMDTVTVVETLSFMSPEACGAIRRIIDGRSDLYSLGIIFYKLLTGSIPFEGETPAAIIHQHAAKQPDLPSSRNPLVPPEIDAVVLKLLEKDPERRYGSARGLTDDLRRVLAGEKHFIPGLTDKIAMPGFDTGCIGRERELDELHAIFDDSRRVCGMLCLIEGEAGVGKTSLIDEFKKRAFASNTHVVCGKYVEGGIESPYSAFVEAIDSFISIFRESPEVEKVKVKQAARQSLDTLGGLLCDFSPGLSVIFDSPVDPGNRLHEYHAFRLAFYRLLKLLGEAYGGLVLVLEDIHWAREEDIGLIEFLAEEICNSNVFVVCTMRSHEHEHHVRLGSLIRLVSAVPSRVRMIEIKGLTKDGIAGIVMEVLRSHDPVVFEIAECVMGKSGGIPLVAIEVLKQLVSENIVSITDGRWNFDIKRFGELRISSNITEVIARRVSLLDDETKDILSISALLGCRFELDQLCEVSGMNDSRIIASIDKARSLRILESSYLNRRQLFFVHDTLRELFRERMPAHERKKYSIRFAKILEDKHSQPNDPVTEADILRAYLYAGDEDKILAHAIPGARAATRRYAYNDTIGFLETARAILERTSRKGSAPWKDITGFLVDALLTVGRNTDAISLSGEMLEYEDSADMKASIYVRMTEAFGKKAEFGKCEESALRGLSLLKDKLPLARNTVLRLILKEFVVYGLRRFVPRWILLLRKENEKNTDLIFRYYYAITNVYALHDTFKFVRALMHTFNLSLSRKNTTTREMAMLFMGYGILCLEFLRFKTALRYIIKGLSIAEKLNDKWHMGKAMYFLGTYYETLGEYEKGIEYSKRSYSLFEEIGDNHELLIAFTILAHNYIRLGRFNEIENLHKLTRIAGRTEDTYFKAGLYYFYLYGYTRMGQYEKAEHYGKLSLELCSNHGMTFLLCTTYIDLGILYSELHETDKALLHLEYAMKILDKVPLQKQYTVYVYPAYADALIDSFLEEERSLYDPARSKKIIGEIGRACNIAVARTRRYVTHFGGTLRVLARYCELRSRYRAADTYYTMSLRHCEKYKLLYEEARTLFEYGVFLKRSERRDDALRSFEKAYAMAKRIGSRGIELRLVTHLAGFEEENTLSRLLDRERLASILRVNRETSSILDIDRLLVTIVEHTLEISGAQRAALFTLDIENRRLVIRAEKHVRTKTTRHYPDELIKRIYEENRVYSSRDELGNAHSEPSGQNREQALPGSFLCIPFNHREERIGIMYLENDDVPDIFRPDDIELLKVFAAQAAISIENAELYQKSNRLVTEVHTLNEEKEEQRNQLFQADKMAALGVLTSGIVHDIATPLGAIKNNASFIGNYSPMILQMLDDAFREDVDAPFDNLPYRLFKEKYMQGIRGIQSCVDAMETLLGNLRRFYKRSDSLPAEEVDLNKVICSSIPLLSHEFSKSGCEPEVFVTKDLEPVSGNVHHLMQAIVNILLNACQAVERKTYRNGVVRTISIRTENDRSKDSVTVRVEDNGIGMDDDHLKKITRPFFTDRGREGGTGLGLFITKSIIENHGGNIAVSSVRGEGTRVIIRLPGLKKDGNHENAAGQTDSHCR